MKGREAIYQRERVAPLQSVPCVRRGSTAETAGSLRSESSPSSAHLGARGADDTEVGGRKHRTNKNKVQSGREESKTQEPARSRGGARV